MNLLHYLKNEKAISTIIIIGAIVVFSAFPLFFWNEISLSTSRKINAEKFGQFGDFIGGFIGSIWALAGVFLFYKALVEQRVDLDNNRQALTLQVAALEQQIEEFKLNRNEQKLSRRVYEEQSKTAMTQQFESSFYSLLNLYLNIKNNLNVIKPSYFKSLVDEVLNHSETYDANPLLHRKNLVNSFIEVYDKKSEELSRYFRSFYRLIIIIDDSPNLTDKEKFYYAKILRAQLSDNELIILSYNSYTFFGKKVQSFILKYNLLKHLPILQLPSLANFKPQCDDGSLINLVDLLSAFLRKNLPRYYDVTNDKPKIEEDFDELKVIFGIYFDDDISIKLYFQNEIENGLSNIDIGEFIYLFSHEILIFQTYLLDREITIEKSKIEFEEKIAFCITIKTDELINLNEDEF
ncbi:MULTISPECIES: putative phage abortive infection protein [Pseudoalteromonas]|uniref:putative phage abortive infection protein n=1 Tax=Pseudoalteromonas TaxID=53246 RepID=UPI0003FA4867|nr:MULTISPECIES: putative phage abortive infection protein [Pseudoalteromonas]|tara:strand:+ start:352 stop:1572 length:1221 start_codon:yes stop_codon:yes gene_type:complete